MKLTSIVFCLALLGGALTSCIDEDIDDCFSINRLTLSYKGRWYDGDIPRQDLPGGNVCFRCRE